jgi:hypothetical protein
VDEEKKKIVGRTCNKNEAERLVKMSRDNTPAERKSSGRPKRRWSDLILD